MNALGEYIFDGEERAFFNFTPSEISDGVMYYHFLDGGYDNDWYEQVSGSFAENIKDCIGEVVHSFSYRGTDMPDQDFEAYVIEWVEKWGANCREAFLERLSKF